MTLDRGESGFFEMVVLAIKAVEGACVIEHCQVLVSVFRTVCVGVTGISAARARGADKSSHTVGWKRVVVVGEVSFVRPAAPQLSVPDLPDTAEAGFTVRDLASVETKLTVQASFVAGRFYGKTIGPTAFCMRLGDF